MVYKWLHDGHVICIALPPIQIDVIEENVRLYDCMTHSEKQFIIEVCRLFVYIPLEIL